MADLPFLKRGSNAHPDRITRSVANVNPNGQRIKHGGMTLVHCLPDCEAEFRSGSDKSVIEKQLDVAGWQVIERDKQKIYRCPGHRVYSYSPMSGRAMDPPKREATGNEKKFGGRSSHDGGGE